MNIFCLFGHQWHQMPMLRERQKPGSYCRMPGPDKACLRCGKLKYKYSSVVPSAEEQRGLYVDYQGQYLRDYFSFEDYRNAINRGNKTLIRKAR